MTFCGKAYTSAEDKLSLIFFDDKLELKNQYVLESGNLVNNIKSIKYGNNIVIGYTTVVEPGRVTISTF